MYVKVSGMNIYILFVPSSLVQCTSVLVICTWRICTDVCFTKVCEKICDGTGCRGASWYVWKLVSSGMGCFLAVLGVSTDPGKMAIYLKS